MGRSIKVGPAKSFLSGSSEGHGGRGGEINSTRETHSLHYY